jgi:hypothetical protein
MRPLRPTMSRHFKRIFNLSVFSIAFALSLLSIPSHAQPIEEVPFITSPDNVTLEMLSSAGVKRGDHVIDLGSGDGRVVMLVENAFKRLV